jgi:hypothetical protein
MKHSKLSVLTVSFLSVFNTAFSADFKEGVRLNRESNISLSQLDFNLCEVESPMDSIKFTPLRVAKEFGKPILVDDNKHIPWERSIKITLNNKYRGINFALLNPVLTMADSRSKDYVSAPHPISVKYNDEKIELEFHNYIEKQPTSILANAIRGVLGSSVNSSFEGNGLNATFNAKKYLETFSFSVTDPDYIAARINPIFSLNGQTYSSLLALYNVKRREEIEANKNFLESVKEMCSGKTSDYISTTFIGRIPTVVEMNPETKPRTPSAARE